MKNYINKSAKRAISLVLAFVMLVGTLFVANVGVSISAGAETSKTATERKTVYLQDSTLTDATKITGLSLSKFEQDASGNYIIDTVEKLAFVCTRSYTSANCSFKVADDIGAFVLQTESYANGIKDLADYNAVKEFFESHPTNRFNWARSSNTGGFAGSFDGNGVAIYGMYADGCLVNYEQPALFPMVEGGAPDGGEFPYTYSSKEYTGYHSKNGTSIKNLGVFNSYVKGYRRAGVVIATDQWTPGGAHVEGFATLDGCTVGNCYVLCTDNYTDGNGATKSATRKGGEAGLLTGTLGNDPVIANNIYVYGSYACYKTNETDTEATSVLPLIRNNSGNSGAYDAAYKNTIYGELHNALLVGVAFDCSGMSKDTKRVSNVFTTASAISGFNGVTVLSSVDNAKGSIGKSLMSNFPWATAETAGNGTIQWYARENDLPTLIMPAGWQDTVKGYSVFSGNEATDYAGGSGTENDPYIIKTADQLYKMVRSSGKDDAGNAQYFKVADGVERIYLNNILGKESRQDIKDVVNNTSYKNWAANQEFFGIFDGNGVDIYGLASYNQAGFIKKMSGGSVVRNVNFKCAYIYDTGHASVVCTEFGSYSNAANKPTIAGVSVSHSYIKSTRPGSISKATTTNASLKQDEKKVVYVAGEATGGTNSNGAALYYIKNQATGEYIWQTTGTAAGIVSTESTAKLLTITDCFYDGQTCELIQGTPASGVVAVDAKAGILSGPSGVNNINVINCVSLGAPISFQGYLDGYELMYNRYMVGGSYELEIVNCYSDVAAPACYQAGGAYSYYDMLASVNKLETKNVYSVNEMPTLNWLNVWTLVTDGDRTIPALTGGITKSVSKDYNTEIKSYLNGNGASTGSINGQAGKYGWERLLVGSGTAEDPYLITNALELARAIGSGGVNLNTKLYYKLTSDIDLDGSKWIIQSNESGFRYVPFQGTLDGDGHIISGMFASDTQATGLIPVLDGGTVKNLHIRNSYVGSNDIAGVIVGKVEKDGTITGCSIENSVVGSAKASAFVSGDAATVIDSYYILGDNQVFFDENGVNKAPTTFYPTEGAKWYKVAGGSPRLVSVAKAHSITDIDGDGEFGAEYYSATDITALRRRLLNHSDYANVYGDVNSDGKISITDLALVRRQMTGTFNSINDGFWRNVELGKVAIYYDQNDTIDMARKLELYLESLYPNLDVLKYAGEDVFDGLDVEKYSSIPEKNAIVLTKTFDEDAYYEYSVDYDAANNVLEIDGKSFTAVEQAVLDFITKADKTKQPESFAGSILDLSEGAYESTIASGNDNGERKDYKKAVKVQDVNGNWKTYYYAWGDEFEIDGSFDTNNWIIGSYKGESDEINDDGSISTKNNSYRDTANANIKDFAKLWVVENGRLTVKRGVNIDATDLSAWNNNSAELNAFNELKNGGTNALGWVAVNNGNGDTVNDSGSVVNDDDVFVDPGVIKTPHDMLFKHGYAEARMALPSDGYSFPAWWTLNGAGTRNSNSIDRTLYGKVYKLNNTGEYAWDGTTTNAKPDGTLNSLKTYKYQIPRGHLEFDIVEFMQGTHEGTNVLGSYLNAGNADYRNYFQLTIHRIYEEHNVNKTDLYIPNWGDTPSITTMKIGDFVTTSSAGTFIHHYDLTNQGAMYPYSKINRTGTASNRKYSLTIDTQSSFSLSMALAGININSTSTELSGHYVSNSGQLYADYNAADSHMHLQKYYTYGFAWTADEKAGTYNLTIYCDLNENGTMEQNERIFHAQHGIGNCKCHSSAKDPTVGNDADLWNQYTYMLLDNAFYSSPDHASQLNNTLLTESSGNGTDKTTLEIEYLRVYQEDGRRDIVTPETEAFNNGDRFNYGNHN